MPSTKMDWVVRQIEQLRTAVESRSRAPQLAHSSFDSGVGHGIEETDPATGFPVGSFGTQFDGTHGAVAFTGPNPPRPTEAVTSAGPELLTAGWDGLFVNPFGAPDETIAVPLDFSHVEVHASMDPNFTAEYADTIVNIIGTARGGSTTVTVAPGNWYVRLVSRSLAGKRSEASPRVMQSVTVLENSNGGYTSQVTGQGLRVTYTGPDFPVPVDVVRLGTFTGSDLISLYKNGLPTFTANGEGDVAARSVSVGTDFFYKGRRYEDMLVDQPRGHMGSASRSTDQPYNSIGGFPEQPYLRLDITLEAGRLYRIYTSDMRVGMTPGSVALVRLRARTGGVATGPNDSILLAGTEVRTPEQGYMLQDLYTPMLANDPSYIPGTKVFCSFLLVNQTTNHGTAGESGFRASNDTPIRLAVEDVGPLRDTGRGVWLTGYSSPNGPVPPPPTALVSFDKTYNATDNRTYRGDNAVFAAPYPRASFGPSQLVSAGIMKALWTFPNMTTDLSGAAINEAWVFLQIDQWGSNVQGNGGVKIGTHNFTSLPADGSGISTAFVTESTNWPSGTGRWVPLPVSVFNGLVSGTVRGITAVNQETYGVASVSKIRVVYQKQA